MIETIRQGLKEDGFDVSISKLCGWFEVPRRTMYYRPRKAGPKLQEKFVRPIKAMIEENSSFGWRTAAHLLGMKTPAEAYASAARPVQVPLGHYTPEMQPLWGSPSVS